MGLEEREARPHRQDRSHQQAGPEIQGRRCPAEAPETPWAGPGILRRSAPAVYHCITEIGQPTYALLSMAAFHDPVVGAAGAGAAGASAIAAQHLRRGPAIQLHQVPFAAAAVQPGMAEVMPEPVRPRIDPGLLAAAAD